MTNSLPMNLQRGNVVLCQVPMPSTQLQQFKIRPALIVSADRLNQILDDVMIVACTSNTSRSLTVTQYLITGEEIASAGIRVESVVRCESIFTLNKLMIIRKLGSLSAEAMNQVNSCLMVALEL
ncbi:type II toxin-antitoxin system PemK/MazF family toxin [Argonema antarcticum]|uniref:type II toxin-antitoxin system PemK/MazF family toxin n=1 Tax=Argonema antarcticum TaxID=2942763 RepID=UPI0020134A96|nr:type II toxin-antitoxin system PemK/MazF family toxin [Argonema antarcticum]MCL1470020.1 type II toxin-antitoxin system PemK/MazF family toxin [Argonema antarcticum A004/B2]